MSGTQCRMSTTEPSNTVHSVIRLQLGSRQHTFLRVSYSLSPQRWDLPSRLPAIPPVMVPALAKRVPSKVATLCRSPPWPQESCLASSVLSHTSMFLHHAQHACFLCPQAFLQDTGCFCITLSMLIPLSLQNVGGDPPAVLV